MVQRLYNVGSYTHYGRGHFHIMIFNGADKLGGWLIASTTVKVLFAPHYAAYVYYYLIMLLLIFLIMKRSITEVRNYLLKLLLNVYKPKNNVFCQ